jgi:hypothetical protein
MFCKHFFLILGSFLTFEGSLSFIFKPCVPFFLALVGPGKARRVFYSLFPNKQPSLRIMWQGCRLLFVKASTFIGVSNKHSSCFKKRIFFVEINYQIWPIKWYWFAKRQTLRLFLLLSFSFWGLFKLNHILKRTFFVNQYVTSKKIVKFVI